MFKIIKSMRAATGPEVSAGFFLAALLFLFTTQSAFAAQTYVSITFDDGRASQVNAGAILAAHGVRGTFFVNSGKLGAGQYYMSLSNVIALAAAGNEVGGHSRTHVDLTSASQSTLIDQVCLW